ncbi:MAG TPA: outer membrane protein transport protein [Pseudomonadales bacterium]|nr:outer membrane protein transport protein [Pseudomonadales bacterium]
MRFPFLRTSLAVSLSLTSSTLLANGLALNEQSASGAGTAYAGRASSALDASTIYGNPAGLSKIEGKQVSGGFAVVKANVDISRVRTEAPGSSKGDMVPLANVPFAFFAMPIDEKWNFGLGMYVPFGVISDYEKSFQGSSHGLYSKVAVLSVQPTLSYKVTDRVAIGFGPTINKIDGKLTNSLLTRSLNPTGQDTRINIKGDDTGFGYNFGLMVDLSEQTTWGITYHSKVDYTLKGHTKVHNAPLPINGKYKAKLDFTTPESIDTSITHILNNQWTLHGGLTWTRWSRLESIDAKNKGVAENLQDRFGVLHEDLKWHNTWSYSIGASYQINPQWVLRSGFALDQSPTTNEHRTVRIPVGHRKILTFGAGWKASDNLTVDLAYAYIRENSTGVNQQDSALVPAYSAKYRNSAHGFTSQATWNF